MSERDELDEDGGPSTSKRSKFGSAANADCQAVTVRTPQQSTERILASELDERIFTYVSNSNSFSFAKFGFLKLGPLCNASESHSFTEANCHVKTVRNENNLALILEFSQLFSRGVMLLSDVKNNRRELDQQEIAAIKILDNFFKERDRHEKCLNKGLRGHQSETDKKGFSGTEIAVTLAEHLLGKLTPGKSYVVDEKVKRKGKCRRGYEFCESDPMFGSTGIGHEEGWHGFADIVLSSHDGVPDTISTTHINESQESATLTCSDDDCVRECKRRPRCQALRYDRRTLICMLYPTDKIPKRDIGGCHQATREEVLNPYALEGKCEEYYIKCEKNETCSLNPETKEPLCEILDCAGRPSRSLPHTEMLHYVDSQVGARAKLQCMSYVEFPGDPSRAVCTERGKWTLNAKIQCKVPQDCTELYEKHNVRESGPHYISPDNRTVVRAFCKMTTEGGWTVVQNRKNASVNFTRSWTEYKAGFGEVTGNYWIGNDALHYLTSCNNTLRIQLSEIRGSIKSAEYSNFRVSNESAKFMMTYDSFITSSNNAVDALGGTSVSFQARNMPFSTIDRDNDGYSGSCADQMRGGWWYNSCSTSNLNGEYCPDARNISCMPWTKNADNLHGHEETVIMIRRVITDTDRNDHSMFTQQTVNGAP